MKLPCVQWLFKKKNVDKKKVLQNNDAFIDLQNATQKHIALKMVIFKLFIIKLINKLLTNPLKKSN